MVVECFWWNLKSSSLVLSGEVMDWKVTSARYALGKHYWSPALQ
jgi:hypothetical protein